MAVGCPLQPAVGPQPSVRKGHNLLLSNRGHGGCCQDPGVCSTSCEPAQVLLVETLKYFQKSSHKPRKSVYSSTHALNVSAQPRKDSEMNIEQEIKRFLEDQDYPAIEDAEWAKQYLVEQFVTFANFEAFRVAGF